MNPPNPLNPRGTIRPPEEAEGAQKARNTLQWLDPLLRNEHFAAFMNEAVAPLIATAQKEALDVTGKTERQRSDAAFQLDALAKVFGWPQMMHRKCLELTRAEEEREKRRQQQPARKRPVGP